MFEIVTPEVLVAGLGLLSIVLTGAFAYVQNKKVEAVDQGDGGFEMAEGMYLMVKEELGDKFPKEIQEAGEWLGLVEQAWEDAKVKTPEFNDYLREFLKVINAMKK